MPGATRNIRQADDIKYNYCTQDLAEYVQKKIYSTLNWSTRVATVELDSYVEIFDENDKLGKLLGTR